MEFDSKSDAKIRQKRLDVKWFLENFRFIQNKSLEYLAKENPDLKLEAVIQTTAGEVYTSEKIIFGQDLQD